MRTIFLCRRFVTATLLMAAVLSVAVSCSSEIPVPSSGRPPASDKVEGADSGNVFESMPSNTGDQCVAISAVTEAVLGCVRVGEDDGRSAERVALEIYESLAKNTRLELPTHLTINGQQIRLDHPDCLVSLCDLVDELYKSDFDNLIRTGTGNDRVLAAEDSCLQTIEALDALLARDSDGTICVCGYGQRTFPDGQVEKTNHMFLICKQPSGERVVYDPNAAGVPHRCSVTEQDGNAKVEWACLYKETRKKTTQSYKIVPAQTYFDAFLREARI